ncbi:MAG: hypothetical protein WDM92_10970 [Caulobacteraceae bacterium]
MARRRTNLSPAFAASALAHAGIIAAALIAWPWLSKPLKLGEVVPVTLVTSGPPAALAPAVKAPEPAPAEAEEPTPEAPPEPAPISPAPARAGRSAERAQARPGQGQAARGDAGPRPEASARRHLEGQAGQAGPRSRRPPGQRLHRQAEALDPGDLGQARRQPAARGCPGAGGPRQRQHHVGQRDRRPALQAREAVEPQLPGRGGRRG